MNTQDKPNKKTKSSLGKTGSFIMYIMFSILCTLYVTNQVYFYFNKNTIEANVISLEDVNSGEYDYVVLEFAFEKEILTRGESIRRSVFKEIEGRSVVTIFYDDFLLEDIYFKARHPYFGIILIITLLFYVVVIRILIFVISEKITLWRAKTASSN